MTPLNIDNRTRLVAEQLLWLRRDVLTTPMHVLKLAYISHGWMLGLTDDVLLYEPVEAWRYGPVVPSIYHRYKSFGGQAIDLTPVDRSADLDKMQRSVVEAVDDVYRDFSAIELSGLTHKKDTPWHKTVRQHGVGAIIRNSVISDYYKEFFSEE